MPVSVHDAFSSTLILVHFKNKVTVQNLKKDSVDDKKLENAFKV